jgi:tetratricopeptide (TPR) repeat protein
MAVQRKIFISYRQADNPDFVDRIRDRLTAKYGDDNVFMDFVSIPPGVQFVDYIRDSMRKCDAVIAIIGPKWVELFQEKAAKFQDDYVRIELGLALELGKPILPICIAGAQVPAGSVLPPELRPLLSFNFAFLDRMTFADRIGRVLQGLEEAIQLSKPTGGGQNKVSTGETPAVKADQDPFAGWKPNLDEMPSEKPAPKSFLWSKVLEEAGAKARAEMSMSAEDYYNRAIDHEAAGNPKAAIDDYNEAIRLNPRYANAYNNRGNLVMDGGNHPAAMIDYDKAIELDPTNALFYNNRGLLKFHNKIWRDYDDAIADFSEAIRLKPDYDQPYLNRGAAYSAKNDYAAAIADYTEAIRLNPTLASAYYNRGICRKELGELDEAIADYQTAARYAPDDPTIYNNLGIVYSLKGDALQAVVNFSRSILLKNPEMHLPYFNRANVQFDQQNYQTAIEDYSEAIRHNPQFASAYLSRGAAYYHLGDLPAAIADYEAYLHLNPDDQAVRDALQQMHEGTN